MDINFEKFMHMAVGGRRNVHHIEFQGENVTVYINWGALDSQIHDWLAGIEGIVHSRFPGKGFSVAPFEDKLLPEFPDVDVGTTGIVATVPEKW